jgi:exodeoxyribonuclease VII large subunit
VAVEGDAFGEEILSVSELTARISGLLEDAFEGIQVVGEVSKVTYAASGHVYLALKDAGARIDAVVWRSKAARLRFRIESGAEFVARGRLSVYAPRGNYQLVIDSLKPRGVGALELAFRQLQEKLAAEGLFEADRKRPLPFLPRRIALVTSPTGAAIRDIMSVIERRFPAARMLLLPVRVQGDAAAGEIAAALESLGADSRGCDVVIVGRGGGSLEDLWAFNEEVVARAIADCPIPVVSAVGHEIDVSISDLVADRRALTPTEAGEIVVPRLDRIRDDLTGRMARIERAVRMALEATGLRIAELARRLAAHRPRRMLEERTQRLDELLLRLSRAAGEGLARRSERLAGMAGRLEGVSPLRVLGRGYSLTRIEGETACLRDTAALALGAEVETILARGRFVSRIESVDVVSDDGPEEEA